MPALTSYPVVSVNLPEMLSTNLPDEYAGAKRKLAELDAQREAMTGYLAWLHAVATAAGIAVEA